jgi:hypothetical protein
MEEWSGKEKVMKQTGNRTTEKEREIQKKYEPSPVKKKEKGKM